MDGLLITHDQLTLGRVVLFDQHGARCRAVSLLLAHHLGITDRPALDQLATGAQWHDVGKAWIPEWIAYKPGAFKPHEYAVMKQHPVKGAQFVQALGLNGGVLEIVRHHHERWDGTGYPDRLAGLQIPMLARVVSVVDTYDALLSPRDYPRYDMKGNQLKVSGQFDHDAAMQLIEGGEEIAFDPKVVRAFRRMKDKEFR